MEHTADQVVHPERLADAERPAGLALASPRPRTRRRRRGSLLRRGLVAADLFALIVAFALAQAVASGGTSHGGVDWFVFLATLPLWLVVAKVYDLYDRDAERINPSTVDEVPALVHLVTAGVWIVLVASWATGAWIPSIEKLGVFWLAAVALLVSGRVATRAAVRATDGAAENLIIVGAGRVGQLVARKVLNHPEYRLNLVGFVDDDARECRAGIEQVPVLGGAGALRGLIRAHDVDRLLIAFSADRPEETVELVRSLGDLDVQVDIVPRLFEVFGPHVAIDSIEGLPLLALAPVRATRSSRAVKRLIDIVIGATALVVAAPAMLVIAVLVRLDSRGPVLFRQTRLGQGMEPFTALKFRTMAVDADDRLHREFIRATMSADAAPSANGLYKLERCDAVTRVGRWLRRTSLDELPQLINVVRGDMSLVGPRPCISYETEHFAPHHFERFQMPAGLTGLWQVSARAYSTFGEALDMDVAYVRGWSVGLDLRLLLQTPLAMLRQRGTT
jgi:exopolysaccharide biosynthesis polyprenyl glycosylphosphotransferase